MAASEDDLAPRPGGHAHLRAGHADREQVISTLKAAFVQGMLTKDELDLRVSQTFAARTYADLAALTADLPAGLADAVQPLEPVKAGSGKPLLRPRQIVIGATGVYGGMWGLAFLTAHLGVDLPGLGLLVLSVLVYLSVLLIAVAAAAENRRANSSARLPGGRAPGAGGAAVRRMPQAGERGQLPPGQSGHLYQAQAARRHRSLQIALAQAGT